jgi:serine/threonine-protein kinase
MSPERLRGSTTEVDGRSDVCALGVMFYRLMAGRLPFDVGGLPLVDAAQRILHTEVAPLGSIDATLRGSIEQVAQRAMAPDPERRYQSAADLAADLRACLEGRMPASVPAGDRSLVRSSRAIVAESDDHRFLAVGVVNGTVLLLDAISGAQLASVQGDGTPLERLAFDADGLSIVWRGGRVERVATASAT